VPARRPLLPSAPACREFPGLFPCSGAMQIFALTRWLYLPPIPGGCFDIFFRPDSLLVQEVDGGPNPLFVLTIQVLRHASTTQTPPPSVTVCSVFGCFFPFSSRCASCELPQTRRRFAPRFCCQSSSLLPPKNSVIPPHFSASPFQRMNSNIVKI